MPNHNSPSVLLVDDNKKGLSLLEEVLKDCDYKLVKASSGTEALSLLLNNEFAVILMDVHMPGMDGFETASIIKGREKTRRIPIIFVTGVDRDERFISHGYEAGAVDYLFKPFDPQILRSKVAVFVELFEQRRQIDSQSKRLAIAQRQEQSRQIEQLEVESRVRFRSLIDAIPHIVWKANSELLAEHFNKRWAEYTGMSLDESGGAGWMAAINQDDLPKFLDAWKKSRATKSEFQIEIRIFHKSENEYRWHLIKAIVEKMSDIGVTSWLITCTEIHDLKKTEALLMKAKLDADSANKAKSAFLSNMSHELRTPLGAIMGFSDLLLENQCTKNQSIAHTKVVKRNCEQLLRVIDEILDISKIESGSLILSNEKVCINNVINAVEAAVSIQALNKGLEINFSSAGEIPEYIITDPVRVTQVLINVVGNAVKFTGNGSIHVQISYKPDSKLVNFSIEDTGTGIDKKYFSQLFRPFNQGDNSTSRKFGGTGLGLALSRKLALALGGDLTLNYSKLGVGSKFIASFATGLKENELKLTTEMLTQSTKKPIAKSINSIDNQLKGKTILVADDGLDNQRLFSVFLNKAGAQVDIAGDGEEAIRMALTGKYDVILMDIQMPIVDGYEATKTLRKQGYVKPIVAVTAYAMSEERKRCIDVGCDDHLSKPIEPNYFIQSVANLCNRQPSRIQ